MDLPIDHFRLLGVGPSSDARTVLNTLAQRLERIPDQGFTAETLQARAKLLQDSADLLSDPLRRRQYEGELTALSGVATAVPALEVPGSLEVAGLLLLLEAGQPQEAFEIACRCLQPPQAPALGSSREADLCLVAALSCLAAAEDGRNRRHFEAAARQLRQGLQLLQRMGQIPELRQRMGTELDRLSPYLVLDLLSRELSSQDKRQEGLALLEQLVQRRGGLEGQDDPEFSTEEFQAFFKQIRSFLTVQEQVDLFSRWAEAGSDAADFLATTALTASGFAQRKPERIAAARERLLASGRSGIEPLVANLHLLLGEVDAALTTFETGASREIREWAARQDREPLGQLCAYCRDWLQRDVLPGYRDLDADPDLEAYFSDRDVIRWVEREDRRAGRSYTGPAPVTGLSSDFGLSPSGTAARSTLPSGSGSAAGPGGSRASATGDSSSDGFDWGLSPYSSPFTAMSSALPSPADAQQEEDEDDDDEDGPLPWRWPDLSRFSAPERPLEALQERLDAWRSAVSDWPMASWVAAAAALGLIVGGTVWMVRPRPPAPAASDAAPTLPRPTPPASDPAASSSSTPPAATAPKPPKTGSSQASRNQASSGQAGSGQAGAAKPQASGGTRITPLNAPQPTEQQLRDLLDSWLQTKAAVLNGGELPVGLGSIARDAMVERLRDDRQANAAASQRQQLDVAIQSVSIEEQRPNRIALRARLRYSDQLLDAAGTVLERTPAKDLDNIYVFGRDQGRWRLVAVQNL